MSKWIAHLLHAIDGVDKITICINPFPNRHQYLSEIMPVGAGKKSDRLYLSLNGRVMNGHVLYLRVIGTGRAHAQMKKPPILKVLA